MTMTPKIWIIDDDESIRWVLEKALSQQYDVTVFSSAVHVMERLSFTRPDVIISDIRMPKKDGLELLNELSETYPELPVIIMTAHSDLQSAVSAYEDGAFDYLPKPFDIDDALTLVERAIRSRDNTQAPSAELQSFPEIIGQAPAMQKVFRVIGRLAHSHMTVLITGESGTGKELVAKALHKHSPRKTRPFVALNVAAIPKELIEAELFGHEKGAFTGATQARQGRFEQANGGTLLLDEIGDMPADCQTRLLRVLAEGEFYRVGGQSSVKVDVRVIAATHQDLESMVEKGVFRQDLYHRLNVVKIDIPPLRQRQDDIPALASYFLQRTASELAVEKKAFAQETIDFFMHQPWRGNVRELENICRWVCVMASGQEVFVRDLPPGFLQKAEGAKVEIHWETALKQWARQFLASKSEKPLLDEVQPIIERIFIEAALEHTGGKKRNAAQLLGWGRNTLTRKLKELQLDMT